MTKITISISIPFFIEQIVVFFLLRWRKRHYGFAFRKIKLLTNEKVDKNDRYAIVDSEDWQELVQYPWQFYEGKRNNRAAVRYYGNKIIYMHRQIMKAGKGTIVDHKNRNSLDNTKRNLRFATLSQNACNTGRRKSGSSKYRGVRFEKQRGRWRAEINCNKIRRHLGYFDDEEAAGRAYDEAAKIYHGEFAVLNFPGEDKPRTQRGAGRDSSTLSR